MPAEEVVEQIKKMKSNNSSELTWHLEIKCCNWIKCEGI